MALGERAIPGWHSCCSRPWRERGSSICPALTPTFPCRSA